MPARVFHIHRHQQPFVQNKVCFTPQASATAPVSAAALYEFASYVRETIMSDAFFLRQSSLSGKGGAYKVATHNM